MAVVGGQLKTFQVVKASLCLVLCPGWNVNCFVEVLVLYSEWRQESRQSEDKMMHRHFSGALHDVALEFPVLLVACL